MSVAELVYTTSHRPDPGDAREVLAFVLLRADTFSSDPDERLAVAAVLEPAKRAAVERWLQIGGRQ